MITEDYISFETAKLLKERGFDEPCYAYWHENENRLIISQSVHAIQNITNPCFFGPAAPTLQMAMKWLREEKHYYIQTMLDSWALGGHMGYYIVIQKTDSDFEMMLSDALDEVFYKTYEEACEAAIKYCLENLI